MIVHIVQWAAIAVLLALCGYFATLYLRLRRMLSWHLFKAERDRCATVRIPANTVRNLGIVANDGMDRTFTHTQQSRHPALLSPARRHKL